MTKYLDIAMWCAYIFLYIIHGIFFSNNSDWSTNIYTQSFSKSLIIVFIEKHMHGNIVYTAMCCAYKVSYSCICSIIYIYIYIYFQIILIDPQTFIIQFYWSIIIQIKKHMHNKILFIQQCNVHIYSYILYMISIIFKIIMINPQTFIIIFFFSIINNSA